MRLRSFLIVFISILVLGVSLDADAQRRNKYKQRRKTSKNISKYRGGSAGFGRFKPHLFVGANLNAANYLGDLAPVNKAASTDISFTRPGFGAFAGYRFHNRFAFRGAINWFRLSADDFSADPSSPEAINRYGRNLSFRNDIKELQIGFQGYLFPSHGSFRQRPPVNFSLFVGLAAVLHEPRGKVPEFDYQSAGIDGTNPPAAPQAGEWVKLRELGTEGQFVGGPGEEYSNLIFAIPLTLGAEFRLPGTNLNAGIEAGIRYTFTDYLDDVSTGYVDLDLLDPDGTNSLARIMSDRSAERTNFDGEARDLSGINFVSRNNGFTTANGYGATGEIRGGSADNDLYFVTQFKLTYFVGNTAKRRTKRGRGRAKFR